MTNNDENINVCTHRAENENTCTFMFVKLTTQASLPCPCNGLSFDCPGYRKEDEKDIHRGLCKTKKVIKS